MARRRRQYGGKRRRKTLLTGTLRVIRPGVAEVQTPEGTFSVARNGVREGMNGDEVQVSLVPIHGKRGDPVAYVQAVMQRACTSVVGTFECCDPLGVVRPLDGRLAHDFFVLPEDNSAQEQGVRDGDVVRARILAYPTRQSAGTATIEQRLGSASELDLGVEAIIASYGITTEFPDATLAEARDVRADVAGALAADALRRDLRGELCVTVDPTDARDYDDAVGVRRLDDGGFRVFVHIADVTHYVAHGSSMDLEARRRTCSVYLVDRVVPMLPERLCNDVCSLRPGEDRLAMTVCVDLDAKGHVRASEAFPSAIRSRARLTYDEVDKFLDGAAPADALACAPADAREVGQLLATLDHVAGLRQRVRRERGSIDFQTVEPKVVLDGDGHPVDVVVRRRTRATNLIEEAMLLANESVAKMLADRDIPTAYRVHERPAPEDLGSCVLALRELGLGSEVSVDGIVAGEPAAIQLALDKARGTTGEPLVNALLLRAQKRAVYAPHNDGHYALGAGAYCHFTSPIRRYPDVLVHRALRTLLTSGKPGRVAPAADKELPQLCRTCSERERVADSAARASQRLKMAELYAERIGERCSGVVVGCERFGLFVMLDDTCAEGLVSTRSLGHEWFAYDEDRLCLRGASTGRTWRMGQRIAVEVVGVDVPKGRIDLAALGA